MRTCLTLGGPTILGSQAPQAWVMAPLVAVTRSWYREVRRHPHMKHSAIRPSGPVRTLTNCNNKLFAGICTRFFGSKPA